MTCPRAKAEREQGGPLGQLSLNEARSFSPDLVTQVPGLLLVKDPLQQWLSVGSLVKIGLFLIARFPAHLFCAYRDC